MQTNISPGIIVLHGNRLEDLRDVAVAWMRRHPLAPLENEVLLAQSNGIAQWLKLALADDAGCGIAAALQIDLPARFLWRAYRAVLGPATIPAQSPLDKAPLTWRLMRLLPDLLNDKRFEPLRRFLADDGDLKKRYQLAERLADLFDQYQVYRADWLNDWAAGRDVLRDGNGVSRPFDAMTEAAAQWQPELWRVLLADVGTEHLAQSRSGVHQRFLEQLQKPDASPPASPGLPRRITVFGISSLPMQTLEALATIARFSQVMLCVHNPCQHYWGDIVEGKELLRHAYRRQKSRAAPASTAPLDADGEHLAAQPLLAAWGRQGRDYIHLLDRYDNPERYRADFERIDLFASAPETLLGQLQNDMLELRSPEESKALHPPVAADDHSLCFHLAHSAQREVEILHDQLLAAFDADPDLRPRDVIVMTPDINAYAPHIEAVFGQFAADDDRHIPFTLADRGVRGKAPLVIALEHLLSLPESRFGVGEIFDLLEVSALATRFDLTEHDLPLLKRWLEGAGVRWGLDAAQRATFGVGDGQEQNTWRFGLRRMLLGYAAGDAGAYADIEPYDEIGSLEAALLGPLTRLLDTLERTLAALRQPASPSVWGQRLGDLLNDFFHAEDEQDAALIVHLQETLDDWQERCAMAKLEENLPLTIVREAWLETLDQGRLSQRFLAGAVNFCTLMPMRAIPFQHVCLLGMNDGDYPRQHPPLDFDLMRHDYRPGDRSRREDDRYLLLEALLSARQRLYISWVGKNIRDNSERPPSVLVGQLRDHLARVWRREDAGDLLATLTTEHPLQPFSRRYFGEDARLFSYAREWVLADGDPADGNPADGVGRAGVPGEEKSITLENLFRFLRNPVQYFFNQRLKVYLDEATATTGDTELFALDGLQRHNMQDELLQAASALSDSETQATLQAVAEKLQRSGSLPLAGFGAHDQKDLQKSLPDQLQRYRALRQNWPQLPESPETLRFPHADMLLEDVLGNLRRNDEGHLASIELSPGALKNQQWKWHRLLPAYVRHVAAAASGLNLTSLLVGEDETVNFAPLSADDARRILADWLDGWREGMTRPLPVACKTAFAWLAARGKAAPEAKAATCYDGDDFNLAGEASQSPTLARAYPDFAAITRNGEFHEWVERLYAPLYRQMDADDVPNHSRPTNQMGRDGSPSRPHSTNGAFGESALPETLPEAPPESV
ncbi:MAG: exodeoxyribonuclease V subunit gamma [Zoogloeaceae bacterium]|jgi:exodeoxyribonuclease V gamma subunit|nr:exodeoxyribonuclease V subunit gamma [Zoogloeaceae bacterium]